MSAGLYVVDGLERGAGVIILATPGHTAEILRHVTRAGLNADGLRQDGRFVVLDAEATLARVMRDGRPAATEFRRVIGPLVEHLCRTGSAGCRVYSEMVSVLWAKGKRRSAIELEGLWNTLVETQQVSLLSTYVLAGNEREPLSLHRVGVGGACLDVGA